MYYVAVVRNSGADAVSFCCVVCAVMLPVGQILERYGRTINCSLEVVVPSFKLPGVIKSVKSGQEG
jgi:hypothetical protein